MTAASFLHLKTSFPVLGRGVKVLELSVLVFVFRSDVSLAWEWQLWRPPSGSVEAAGCVCLVTSGLTESVGF